MRANIALIPNIQTLTIHTLPALSQDAIAKLKSTALFERNHIILGTDTNLQELSGSIEYTYAIETLLYKKLLIVWLFASMLLVLCHIMIICYKYVRIKAHALVAKFLARVDTPYAPFIQSNPHAISSNHIQADSTRSAKLIFLLCFGIFVIGFGLRFGYMLQKTDLHIDEVYSISISSNSHRCIWGGICTEGIFYGKEIKEQEFWHDRSMRSALSNVKNLYLTNNGDSHSHADLYYILLRLWHIGVQTGDLDWIIQRAVGLNLFVFYPLACLFALLLGRRLFGTSYALVAFFMLVSLNSLSISATMLMREYALQQCMFLGFAWIMVQLYCKESLTKVDYVLGAIITACLLLSGYFTILFVVVAFGAMWFLSLGRGSLGSRADSFAITAVFGFACTFALYPIYHKGFLGGHAKSALDKAKGSLDNLLESMGTYGQILLQDIFTPLLLCAMAMVAIWIAIKAWANKASLSGALGVGYFSSRECFLAFGFGALALGFGAVVMYLAPWKTLRFVMPILPLLYLLVVLLFVPLLERKDIWAKSALLLFGLNLALYHHVSFVRYSWYADSPLRSIYGMHPVFSQERTDNYTIPTIYNAFDIISVAKAYPYFHDLRLYHFVKDSKQSLERARELGECFLITQLPLEQIQQYLGKAYRINPTQQVSDLVRYHITKTTKH